MSEWIVGRNPVYEVLRAKRRSIHQLLVAREVNKKGHLGDIFKLASRSNVPVKRVPRDQLHGLGTNHQGVALKTSAYPYAEITDILGLAEKKGEPLLVLVLDVLEDPQNVGTLIRTAEAIGVHGIVLPYRQTATITPAVVSASSGASEHLFMIQANIAQTITLLKEEGAWVVGLETGEDSQSPSQIDLSGPIVVVVGSEGQGMRKLVRSSCDFLMELPMRGQIDSLNAAVAGSVALFLAWEARNYLGRN
ncbi:MAG: 23S rRNA (guanosine(2251)-2'-O)-methyltransferase RlmB [Anaerolinea sp. 4484_236]|nr:MAG: 23S rRNA (guanosine(2251)-2'-O)-methyltransferase RlmB [Anaerolinea sp. 4484_236]RLD06778.1 MAG: 23S rRNA (guanosine(2251)-2'-O)-methyltransferase RlmB [Chloroflexota bacterium]